jgi:hypothetical protein
MTFSEIIALLLSRGFSLVHSLQTYHVGYILLKITGIVLPMWHAMLAKGSRVEVDYLRPKDYLCSKLSDVALSRYKCTYTCHIEKVEKLTK